MPITATRKVTIIFPAHIFSEVEQEAKTKKTAIDKLILKIVENSLRLNKPTNLADLLREGYLVNASRDRAISEEFKFADTEIDRELDRREGK